ncbi:MAG: hypothetical protein WBW04_06410 [Nitrolancea sp.]
MKTDSSNQSDSSNRPSKRVTPGRVALLALLGRRGDRLQSGTEAVETGELTDESQSAVNEPAEAPSRFPLLSNFRSRSRHRRGMPSPMSGRR